MAEAAEIPVAPDEQTQQAQYKLDGQWLPSVDPLQIGPNNYQTMTNLRYRKGDTRPEGIDGYTKVNPTTALTTYPYIMNGIQLRNYFSNTFSWVVVQSEDSGGTQRIYLNKTDVPDQGDFETTAIHTPETGASTGRFSYAPEGNITYANGKESYIWAGDSYEMAGFFLCDDSSLTNPRDYTTELADELDTTDYVVTIAAATTPYGVIMSRRKLQGVNWVVETANASTSTQSWSVYTSSGWTAVTNGSDGTDSGGGITLSQSGSFTFDSTVDDAVPMHFEGFYAYAYRFNITAGSPVVSFVTVDAPWQPMTDLWDGVSRQPIYVELDHDGSSSENFTAYVLNPSDIQYPIGLDLSGTTTSGTVTFVFEERQSAIDVDMLGTLVNATATTTITGTYWDGDSAVSLPNFVDGTSGFTQSGRIEWTPPANSAERKRTLDRHFGYAYVFSIATTAISGAHADKSVIADVIGGVTAQYVVPAFDWTSTHKKRILGVKKNVVYYTPAGYADAWNGLDSSKGGIQALEFGPGDPLTCGASLYNRYGSNTFEVWVVFSDSQAFQLKGLGPINETSPWDDDEISTNVGCPAPLTLCSAEIGFEISAGAKRNILLWISTSGPMAYDGAVLYPIKGLEKFFDPNETECINFEAIETSRGWYDPVFREWNVVIPSGSGQTTPNKQLVLDLEKQRWFEKDTGAKPIPLCGFQVLDTDGNQYVYGGLSTGYLMRLEYGTSWDGTGIEQTLLMGDIWPDGNAWHQTEITNIKWICKKTASDHSLSLLYRGDTSITSTVGIAWEDTDDHEWLDTTAHEWDEPSLTTMSIYSDNSDRVIRSTVATNLIAWTHAIGARVTTTTDTKCFQPLALAIEYKQYVDDY